MKNDYIDELDQKILALISENARIPFLEVARECNISGAAIHQRITKLIEKGVILGSRFVFDWSKIGYETTAVLSVNVAQPACMKTIVKELEKIPEIIECHYSSGRHGMVLKVIAQNNRELLQIIQEKLNPLGFSSIETMILLEKIFSRQGPIN